MTLEVTPIEPDYPPPSEYDAPPDEPHNGTTPLRRIVNGTRSRELPHDDAAERAIISACLYADAATIDQAQVAPADFYRVDHQNIWTVIQDLRSQDIAPDASLVAGRAGINTELVNELASSPLAFRSNVANYATLVRDHAHRRRVIDAARALSEAAYNTAGPDPLELIAPKLDALAATNTTTTGDDDAFYTDLEAVMNGDTVGDPPTIGQRDDHACCLLYAGKLNNIIGESESGKSMIAQWIAVQEAHAGNHVVYLDFEDSAAGVVDRFHDMGATSDDLARIHYRRVDEPWTPHQLGTLRASLAMHHPTYCVIDGVTNAMVVEGLDPLDNKQVAKFYGGIPALLRSTGAATFMVDHVVKARQDRAPGAIGAQHKRAGIDGVSLMLRMKEPAGRNRVGTGWLTVDKDRPGFLREYAADGKTIADVTIRSDGMSIRVELAPSSVQPAQKTDTGVRRTGYMERVSKVLEGHGDAGASTRTLRSDVSGRGAWVMEAAATLVAEGYARVERAGAANRYVSVKAYRESMEAAPTDDFDGVDGLLDDDWDDQPY